MNVTHYEKRDHAFFIKKNSTGLSVCLWLHMKTVLITSGLILYDHVCPSKYLSPQPAGILYTMVVFSHS